MFLSYDHDDVERAAPIASALEKAGHSVWWDRHIHGGAAYNDEIEAAVEAASALVVLWSERSIRSTWVRDEAAEGRDQNKLVPVLLDAVKPPMGFRQFQTIDLSRSGRTPSAGSVQQILDSINKVGGAPQTRSPAPMPAAEAKSSIRLPDRINRRAGLAIAALVLAAIAIAYFLVIRGHSPTAPVVVVAAADNSSPSRSLADDLFIKLGSLQSANASALQLVEEGSGSEPDLRFNVAQRIVDGRTQATVALLAGRDGGLLWSREFRQEQGPEADLRQQVAYSAALVLTCATEAMAPGHQKLDDMTLKLYLGGCARFTGESDYEPQSFVDLFGKLVQQAPDFERGWAKLIAAETDALLLSSMGDATIKKSLQMHIRQARKVNPTMAEAYIAEAWMMPIWNINGWMPLSKAAVSKNPSNVIALSEHSNDMFQVGRVDDAVTFARRAVQADPLSPWVRLSLISALAHAGEVEAAKGALVEAERLWPGASNLIPSRFYLMARYDDPRQALAMLQSGRMSRGSVSPAMESFLEARIDPNPTNIERAIEEARTAAKERRWFPSYIETLATFRRKEELIEALANFDTADFLGPASVFETRFGFLQDDVRFMAIMGRWGSQLDYWRKSGIWPDFCSRPGLPYDCKVEAAKVANLRRRPAPA